MNQVRTLTNKDALYSSIYRVLGLCYDWNTEKLANLYGVTQAQFEIWLSLQDFTIDEVKILRKRTHFENGFCKHCGIKTENTFCSDKCKESRLERDKVLLEIIESGKVTLDAKRNIKYNIITGEVVYD